MLFTNEKGVRYLTGVSVNKGVYFLERITNNKIEYVIMEDKDGNIVYTNINHVAALDKMLREARDNKSLTVCHKRSPVLSIDTEYNIRELAEDIINNSSKEPLLLSDGKDKMFWEY